MSEQSGSWQPDPFGRHEHRWWDGTSWTDQVADDGVTSVDPPGDAAPDGAAHAAATATPPRGGSSNVVGFAVGAVVLLVLLGAAAYFLLGSDDEPTASELAASFEDDLGLEPATAACMGRELEGVFTRDRLSELGSGSGAMPTGAEMEAMFAATAACGAGNELGDFAEGDTYGDNPELDGLWDDCEDGDMGACDELYLESEIGSEYERFGDTCGGRQEEGTGQYCDEDE